MSRYNYIISDGLQDEIYNAVFKANSDYGKPSTREPLYKPKVIREIESDHGRAFMLSLERAHGHNFVVCFVHGSEGVAADEIMNDVGRYYGGKFDVHGEFLEGEARFGSTSFSVFGFFTVKETDAGDPEMPFLPN